MRNLKKLIAITAMTALLLFALTTGVSADEKIYTSEIFTLPLERLEKAEEILDAQEQAAAQAEQEQAAEPGEEGEVPEEGQAPAEAGQPEEAQTPAEAEQPEESQTPAEGQQPEESQTPVEAEQPEESQTPVKAEQPEESQIPAEGQQPEEAPAPEGTEDPDEDEEPDEDDDEDEGLEELGEDAGEVIEEVKPKRQVIITSNQGEVVTEGEVITLRSELIGFDDDEQVTYQWQVDRGEGNGWEDVDGATRDRHVFIADRTTIRYSWRLIVNVIGE
ncbi:MAG: hypothetical protein K6F61_02690 [Clostridiales bacterium]|nr:hypothetical protein [Clostridiales bacterium]